MTSPAQQMTNDLLDGIQKMKESKSMHNNQIMWAIFIGGILAIGEQLKNELMETIE